MSHLLHADDSDDNDNDDAKAIAIPQVFSENSSAKIASFEPQQNCHLQLIPTFKDHRKEAL